MSYTKYLDWSNSSRTDSPQLDDMYNTALYIFPHIAVLPFNFDLSMVVFASYILVGIVLKIIELYSGNEGFARSPWWALVVGKS
jgi:hypothetical protein